MREMAIFGVPCWGLMVSEGVPGSNDRAAEGQLPQSGHAISNTGKIYAAPRVALFGSWNWRICFWFIWRWAVLKCSYCGNVFGAPSLNLGLNLLDQHPPFDTTLNFYETTKPVAGQICQKLRSNWSVTGGHTAVNWHENNWAAKSILFSSRVFKDSLTMLLFPGANFSTQRCNKQNE